MRIESDDDDDAGGCNNPNEEIMDLEDMGDYMESASPTKVRSRSSIYAQEFFIDHPATEGPTERNDYAFDSKIVGKTRI